jgi:hypothetical protein
MLPGLDQLKQYFNNDYIIDDWMCIINCTFLCFMMVVAAITLYTQSMVGEPLSCITHQSGFSDKFVNNYCLTAGTFSIQKPLEIQPYPGISTEYNEAQPAFVISHEAYKFIGMLLLSLCFGFYLPKLIWRSLERGVIKNYIENFNKKQWMQEARPKVVELIATVQYHPMENNRYFMKYLFCKSLYLVNILCQYVALNYCLYGNYFSYGWDYITTTDFNQNALHLMFPRFAKCSFHNFGITGTVEKHDFLCAMNHNQLHGKIFLILWFAFAIVGVLTAASLAFDFKVLLKGFRKPHYSKLSYGSAFLLNRLKANLIPATNSIIDEELVKYTRTGHLPVASDIDESTV